MGYIGDYRLLPRGPDVSGRSDWDGWVGNEGEASSCRLYRFTNAAIPFSPGETGRGMRADGKTEGRAGQGREGFVCASLGFTTTTTPHPPSLRVKLVLAPLSRAYERSAPSLSARSAHGCRGPEGGRERSSQNPPLFYLCAVVSPRASSDFPGTIAPALNLICICGSSGRFL